MKRSFINKSVLVAGCLSTIVSANAGWTDIKPYVGAGLEHNSYSFSKTLTTPFSPIRSIKGNGLGIAVPILGIKFHDNLGLEAGYSFNKKIAVTYLDDNNTIDTDSTKIRNMHLDLIGSMPIADKVDLIAGIGIGKVKLKDLDNSNVKYYINNIDDGNGNVYDLAYSGKIKSKYNYRVKIGAQYNFNSNFATRLMFTYQPVNYKFENNIAATPAGGGAVETYNYNLKLIKNIKTFSLGAVYTF